MNNSEADEMGFVSSVKINRGHFIYDDAVYITIGDEPLTQGPDVPGMLTFTLYCDDYEPGRSRLVHIDPSAVISVEETERRPAYRGCHQVAIITLTTGKEYVVEDGARSAARQIAEGKQQLVGA